MSWCLATHQVSQVLQLLHCCSDCFAKPGIAIHCIHVTARNLQRRLTTAVVTCGNTHNTWRLLQNVIADCCVNAQALMQHTSTSSSGSRPVKSSSPCILKTGSKAVHRQLLVQGSNETVWVMILLPYLMLLMLLLLLTSSILL